jgi:non-specific serine/threonine protein kinase
LALAERVESGLRSFEQELWFERLEMELDNIRAALEWSLTKVSQTEAGMRLAAALWSFWRARDYHSEGCKWMERGLAGDAILTANVRAKVLRVAGDLARQQGDNDRATALSEESLALFQRLGDKTGAVRPLINLAAIAQSRGNLEKAKALVAQGLVYSREAVDKSEALNQSGEVARGLGNYHAARAFYEESLAIARTIGHKRAIAVLLQNLSVVALHQNDYQSGEAFAKESLDIGRRLKHRHVIVSAFVAFSGVAIARRQLDRAVRLLGATEAQLGTLGLRLDHPEQVEYDSYVKRARDALDTTAFARTWAEGQAMTLEQAIEYALADQTG